ncbi:hypothetical protein [Vulcaniibacterium tengchongense]|uniref:YfhO family protein n=1 Tax=Vulcaniibacterium tengchongense TaxID=1273429 RepID=A0A3N4V0Y0_9GAMM|nr:hypothetical protein [Vulcaniibacterium tengchongense]RPE75833.1 hypothetical protein EDC50_2730 [Vulcaniibacterium tengchongense]
MGNTRQFLARAADAALSRPRRLLVGLWLLLCGPWLLGARVLPYDAAQEFYPAVAYTVQQLQRLQGPWWNPLLFGGYPHFADPQGMTFQPTVILPMLLSPLPSMTWFSAVVVLHVLVAGLGATALARDYRLAAAPQLVFALTLMFGAVAASRVQHVPMIVSYAFLPWLWWALRRLSQRPGVWTACGVGVFGGLCALQMTQVTYLIGLFAVVYGVGLIAGSPQRGRYLAFAASAAALALLICLPQWLSTFAYLPFTNRAQLPLEAATSGSLSHAALGTLLGADFLWNNGEYLGPGDLSQDYLYLGAVPLAAWTLWGRSLPAAHRRLARGLTAVAALTLVYALGTHAPIYGLLYRVLPGLDLFRRPADALFLFVPAAALLAALSLDARLKGAPLRPNWPAWIVLALLVAYSLWHAFAVMRHPAATAALWISAIIAAATVWLLRRGANTAPVALLAVIALVSVDLSAHNVRARYYGGRGEMRKLYRGASWPDDPASAAAPALTRLRDILGGEVAPLRAEVYGLDPLINGATVRGMALSNGYNPLLYAPYAQIYGVGTHPMQRMDERRFTPWAPDYAAAAFDLLGLRAIASREPAEGTVAAAGAHWRLRDTVLPRVLNPTRVALHAQPMPPPGEYGRTDFRQQLWLPAPFPAVDCAAEAAGIASIERVTYSANLVEIDYRADRPAWIVFNEIVAPGWMAQVDGREVPLLRANALFRGACVPGGSHRLAFRFSPMRMIRSRWTRDAAHSMFSSSGSPP